MEIVSILMIALLIEAAVKAIKPLWNRDAERVSAPELVSIALGVALAVLLRINLLEYVVRIDAPDGARYVFYVLTGIALGRGPSFLHDLWKAFQELKQEMELEREGETAADGEE